MKIVNELIKEKKELLKIREAQEKKVSSICLLLTEKIIKTAEELREFNFCSKYENNKNIKIDKYNNIIILVNFKCKKLQIIHNELFVDDESIKYNSNSKLYLMQLLEEIFLSLIESFKNRLQDIKNKSLAVERDLKRVTELFEIDE